LGSIALVAIACSLALPWFEYDDSTARDTPPGGPQPADETGIVTHSFDLYASHVKSDIPASNAWLARTMTVAFPILLVAAFLAVAALTAGDTPPLARHVPRRVGLVLCGAALLAVLAVAVAAWFLAPRTMAGAGIRAPYTARLTGHGYIRSTMAWGWYSLLLGIPALAGAGLFKFAAGAKGVHAVEGQIQEAKKRGRRKEGPGLAGMLLILACLVALPHPATAQASAFYQQDGIHYYRATGTATSGHMSVGFDPSGTHQQSFRGCLVAKVNPDRDKGRIEVDALVAGVPFEAEFNSFLAAAPYMQGGIATTVAVDGSEWDGHARHPAVMAGLAAWGTATISAGGVGAVDPATGSPAWRATYFTTPQGFRDNATGAILADNGGAYMPGGRAKVGTDDWETHLMLESPPVPAADPTVATFTGPENGVGYIPPTPEYRAKFPVENVAFGGTATLQVDAKTIDPVGTTDLTFVVRDVTGQAVVSLKETPDSQHPAAGSTTFNITRFGRLEVDVQGATSLASYSITLTQTPPPAPTILDFWWDDVAFGDAGVTAEDACQQSLRGTAQGVAPIPPLAQPPAFPLLTVVLTVVGLSTVALVGTSIIVSSRADVAGDPRKSRR
jgi:hypothetical protein